MALSGYRYFGRFSRINLSDTQREAFSYLSLIIFALVIFGMLAIKPSIVFTAKLIRKLNLAKELNYKLSEKILDLEKAQKIYGESKENVELVESILPREERLYDFIKLLVTGAEGNNIHILGVQPKEGNNKTNKLPSSSIVISIRGKYSDIYNYVDELETSKRITTIRSISIKPEGDVENFVIGEIEVALYWSN